MAFDSQRTGFAEPASYLNNRRPDNTGAQVAQGSQPAGQVAGAEGPHMAPDSKPKGLLSSFFNFRRSEDTGAEVSHGSQPTGQAANAGVQSSQPAGQAAGAEGAQMPSDWKPTVLAGSAGYFDTVRPDNNTGAEVAQASQPTGQAPSAGGSTAEPDSKPKGFAASATQRIFGA